MIRFENATKQQLLTICLHEDCSLIDKYAAARELQLRKWSHTHLVTLLRLWGQGYTMYQIAEELEADIGTVNYYLNKYGLFGKRVNGRGFRTTTKTKSTK